MNTNPVKNIIIALLTVLVGVLSFLIFLDERQFVLSSEQEANILTILSHNEMSISAGTEILRSFKPARQLDMARYEHDALALASRFFGEDADFNSEGGVLFYCENTGKFMEYDVRDNIIIFGIPEGFGLREFGLGFVRTDAMAEELALLFIEEILGGTALEMTLYSSALTPEIHYLLTFYGSYRGNLLYSSQIRIRVTEFGITRVVYSHFENRGFVGDDLPIFSPDEALLALLNQLRSEGVAGPINLIDMQMVYDINPNDHTRAVPAYLFTVVLGNEQRFNYIFNAHTNTYMRVERII
jgi:hypothetical protein